ncbi:hypothetical protein [Pseudomonas aeruginosa]|uniref:hypothetical protein n=1 Tax=Pseudomonas aeruginosa TaxID=287 RepID=UPI001A27AE35|nr:hypothetical protein [Pseudomonas aeruginosa]MBG7441584.1 hypothetical protein [Pseudomonas aeruginosa]MDU0512596.1 hypothetical protein [Pseudomonas aeruginosa]HED8873738.1 hypothetical protein [Pseudomonas aeruginosa]
MDKSQRDIQWLGDEDAHLAPAARGALGILLESNDWSWWDDPSKAQTSLAKAVPPHTPARWGGDSSAMDADQWVDPLRAIMLGRAFNALNRQDPLRVKVSRSVWGWPGGADTVGAAVLELSQLVGPGHVFPEWERNTKPRFPVVPRLQEGQCVVTSPNRSLRELIGDTQEYIEWSPHSRIADIVVASSVEALYTTTAARVVILYNQRVGTALAHVSRLRGALSAQCVVYVAADESNIVNWLKMVLRSWAGERTSFADAVETAASSLGLHTQILSSTQSFLLGRNSFFSLHTTIERQVTDPIYERVRKNHQPDRTTQRVIDLSLPDSASLSQIDASIYKSGLEPPYQDFSLASRVERPIVVRPSPPVERVLNARVRQGQQELQKWPREGVVYIDVDIRVRTPLRDSRPAFPDSRIEWQGESKVLQVHLFEFGREPASQAFKLPRTGGSEIVTFSRDVGRRRVDLRFLVSDGAQILQTARLQSAPDEPIRFFIENLITPVHRTKEPFDVALLVNDSLGNKPSVTIITEGGEAVFSPLSDHETAIARNSLLNTLQEAVVNPNAPLEPLMLKLANRGALLLNSLRSIEPTWPSSLNRVQLVTQSDAFFPIEYLYEGTVPESTDAVLCTQRAECLKKGQAIPGCGIRAAGEQLCPMGFLGISGVVERHAWKTGQNARVWAAPRGGKPKRHRVEDLSTIAFAASDKADNFADADVAPHEIVRITNIETSLGVRKISDWPSWKARLAEESPSLLLLLVHLEDDAVFVGTGSGLNLAAINEKHVGNAPVVIAIGCSSGYGEIPGGSLPAVLQRSGARVVVAAMTSVLGRHANRVARDMAMRLNEAAKARGSVSIGEIISRLRRRLLADGLALGLAVVAFGDADIVLGKE